ncbi:Eukaryotic translation initiation factor 4B1 [Linum perenne]
MSKPWGNIGTWAAEAEREEEEMEAASAVAAAAPLPDTKTYPSLREAVTAKPKKKKMSLNEFYSSAAASGGCGGSRKGLTPEEMLRLPTGPRERDPDEMQFGGFSGYGGGGRTRENSSDGQWGGGGGGGRRGYGGGGGFDDDRRGPANSRVSDFENMPSRADEADNWATGKKAFVPSMDSGRQSRYGSIGSGGGGGGMGGGGSRADEVDNWATGKKPVAVNPARSSTFGSGFRNSGPEPDRWTRGGGGDREVETERPRLVLNPPKADAVVSEPIQATNKPNPFGAARPREEILAEKGLDWRKLETETDTKKSSSNSANSSRPSSAHSIPSEIQGTENVAIPVRPKVNPFGDAKPREVLLQERGQDWRKIDRELDRPRSIDRPETEEEKSLKQEISQLKEEYQKEQENKESAEGSDGDQSSLKDIITQKEKELETLTRDFDDKVRFSSPRPGSGAGRTSGFPDRPSSRSGSIDESRNAEFKDRPRSRGGAQDIWTRPGDERRTSFQGSRERPGDDRRSQQGSRDRGFLGSRDFDRPRSRDRW